MPGFAIFIRKEISSFISPFHFMFVCTFIVRVSAVKVGWCVCGERNLNFWIPASWLDQFQARHPHPGICRAFFSLLLPHIRAFAKEVSPGVGHCQKQPGLSDFKSSIWFHSTCANIRTIVSTCERELTKRRKCTVRERVAVFAVRELKAIWAITDPIKIH